jgi:murein DD-endopeptidase MepM/ murein hydrolase activator NlpD
MKKLSLELPKYRLMFHYQLVKRRKPLVTEPIVPSIRKVHKKYRTGTLLGKFARHLSEHKSIRKFFAGNLAALVVTTSFIPSTKANDFSQVDNPVIQASTTLNTEKSIQFPLEEVKINQGYSFFHPGLDLGSPIGSSVKSIKPGRVIEADYSRYGYGNTILIDHGGSIESRYAHLSKIEVSVGDEIDMNQEIGQVGITGHSTGPHLHLEIHQNGFTINPFSILPR